MKNLTRVFTAGMLACVFFVMFSCKKQLADNIKLQTSASLQPSIASQCKAAVFGAYDGLAWTTIAQKWYSNGTVKYLKAKFLLKNKKF